MADRELLELAAKAAGIEITPHPNAKTARNLVFTVGGKNWNPLTDDGDALRLAVKLGITIMFDCSSVWCEQYGVLEHHNGDPFAATRRAIVRAAAEIGRASG